MMELIGRNIDQIQRHVDDLMDIARISRGKIQLEKSNLDLRDMIHLAVEQVHPLIKAKGQKLFTSVPTDPVNMDADPTRLQQIIANLLNNAAKYTQEGGSIWITVEAQNAHANIKVKDNGIGISSDLLPRIFDIYIQDRVQSAKMQGGLGLGLTIVKTLVELHGGTIGVESEFGKGSTFTVNLPVSNTEAPTPVSNKVFNGSHVNCDRKILVVDDNVDAATSLQMMFAMEGCDVIVAHDGEEAVKTFQGFRPDIVLLDIGLPKLDGYQVAEKIRAMSEQVTLIAVTGYGQPSDKQRSTAAGFDAHVVKPVEPCRFKTLVNTTFEARSKRSGSHVQVPS
jgi:CheY-like chemotaxis protein/two-component sensor histidine kinase